MIDGGVGIAALVSVGTKFVERSKFTARHEASCDKEADKTLKLAERFDRIPQEDVDHFEFQEYNMLHSKSMEDLRHYRDIQEEYKRMDWFKEPIGKVRTRGRVRHAKRSLQSSSSQEERHLHDLETYSRANSSRGSSINSRANSDSGLDLEERFSRPYRTDSCSIRAVGGSPPSASLEDICSDEKKAQIVADVSTWLSSAQMDNNSSETSIGVGSNAAANTNGDAYGAECSNCGTKHTPLLRRGLNDKLNCNACALYFKLHKRPRPMGDSSRTQAGPRQESNSNAADVNGDAYGAECSNCGTKHTPFWRRGLNDELNCNACGLYFKLHKRPRPLRYSSGGQAWPSPESDVMARSPAVAAQLECYNCYTTATALWRKDDEGNTVCNPCRLYYNLHGTVRPVSATSIGKRPRNDSRRRSLSSLGLGFSTIHQSQHRQRDGSFPPTLVPDCSTVFDYISQACNLVPGSHWEGHPSSSSSSGSIYSSSHHHHQLQGANAPFPNTTSSGGMDFLSFSPSDPCCELDLEPISPRTTKRRKMTTDSLSELPSSTMFY